MKGLASMRNSAHGVLLLYDAQAVGESPATTLKEWLDAAKLIAAHFVLTGAKCDTPNAKVVRTGKVKALAEQHQLDMVECSAKTGAGVNEAFEMAIVQAVERMVRLQAENKGSRK